MDERTEKEINERVERVLKEMGAKEPPLLLEDVMDFLDVHRSYYSLKDPSLMQEVFHKMRIGASKAKDLVKKIDLKGLWLPDQKKILIDQDVPQKKHRWITAHELGHRIVPWHADFLQGDTAETLEPDYHEQIEAEANYAASALIFMASRFSSEARDYAPSFQTIKTLSSVYGNTQATTLRRFVLHSHDKPMLAVIMRPHWDSFYENALDLCRYFVPSKQYSLRFSKVPPIEVIEHLIQNTSRRRGGPVGGGTLVLADDNGQPHEFLSDVYYNTYDLLCLISYIHPCLIQG